MCRWVPGNCIAIVMRIAGEMTEVTRKRGWRVSMPIRRRALSPLAGVMALVAQLILAPLHSTIVSPGSAELAELAALTGQQFVLCGHTTGDHPSAPDHSDCDRLCCHLNHSLAVVLPPLSPVDAVFWQATQFGLPATISLHASQHWSFPLPRGPPQPA